MNAFLERFEHEQVSMGVSWIVGDAAGGQAAGFASSSCRCSEPAG